MAATLLSNINSNNNNNNNSNTVPIHSRTASLSLSALTPFPRSSTVVPGSHLSTHEHEALSALLTLLEREILADVQFAVGGQVLGCSTTIAGGGGGGKVEIIAAHRSILAARSTVWKEEFLSTHTCTTSSGQISTSHNTSMFFCSRV
jgi:hypothetical protein